VGRWVQDKHYYLERYIEATRAVRAKYLRPEGGRPAGGAAFIDLFAGPGRSRIRESGMIIPGSPLVALAHAKAPFTTVILCELEGENIQALESRTVADKDRVRIVHGDCNFVIGYVTAQIPRYGLNVALLDPFSVDQLRFATIAALAQFKRMDLIIHFPTMDLKRNVGRDHGRVERFLGGSGEEDRIRTPADVVRRIETLRTNLAAFGYTGEQVRSMAIKNNKKNVLYHLVFASKNRRGDAIWNDIVKRESGGQGNLF
jgi:three-Cys-motif partner protein